MLADCEHAVRYGVSGPAFWSHAQLWARIRWMRSHGARGAALELIKQWLAVKKLRA